jgi:hypothetical protein
VFHDSDGVVDIKLGLLGETLKGMSSFDLSLTTDEPPGTLGGETDTNKKRDGKGPLESKGDTVGPFRVVVDERTEDTGTEELTDDPTHVDVAEKTGSDG